MYVCMYMYVYVCIYICMYICMYVCIYMYVCVYVYICMSVVQVRFELSLRACDFLVGHVVAEAHEVVQGVPHRIV